MELILASGSARRRELLTMCGYDFTVMPCSADESAVRADDPRELVRELALLKARTVFDLLPEERRGKAAVLGSDTVVALRGRVLGKPADENDAAKMLKALSGRINTVHTGVAVVTAAGESVCCDSARVRFCSLTDEEIKAYVATGEPMDKAGAYGIQGLSSMFISSVEGSYFTVVGLPVHIVYSELKKIGILPSAFRGARAE